MERGRENGFRSDKESDGRGSGCVEEDVESFGGVGDGSEIERGGSVETEEGESETVRRRGMVEREDDVVDGWTS